MVPDKFNMVDMEGIDLIESQGVAVEGLYDKLVESIAQCRYQCLYNWKFDGILIPPVCVEMSIEDEVVYINEGVTVDVDDVLHIHSLEIVIEPTIQELNVAQNGEYLVPEGVDGYNPVNVDVEPVIQSISIFQNGVYDVPSNVDGYNPVTVNVVPQYQPMSYEDHLTDSYAYVGANGAFSSSEDDKNTLTVYEVGAGYYVLFLPSTVSNRYRAGAYYGKTIDDFSPYIDTAGSDVPIYSTDINITGNVNITDMTKRFYITMAQSGSILVVTSNTGVDVTPILLKINS
jgi:hypothetical protein